MMAMTTGSILAAALLALGGCVAAEAPAERAEPVSVAVAPHDAGAPEAPANSAIDDAPADLARKASYDAAMADAEARQRIFDDPSMSIALKGSMVQGGLVFGQTLPGASATLDGEPVMVSDEGKFALGFGRDHGASALLVVTQADGSVIRRALDIADREFPVDRIDGLDQSKVSGFTEGTAARDRDRQARRKSAARRPTDAAAPWSAGFLLAGQGPHQRRLRVAAHLERRGEDPAFGLDVAAPARHAGAGPCAGIVRLAEPDMYFEGGLVFIDHGHWVESAFLHLSRIDVTPGQGREAGDPIGAVGVTGRATGPHMHWSLKWTGRSSIPSLSPGRCRRQSPPRRLETRPANCRSQAATY